MKNFIPTIGTLQTTWKVTNQTADTTTYLKTELKTQQIDQFMMSLSCSILPWWASLNSRSARAFVLATMRQLQRSRKARAPMAFDLGPSTRPEAMMPSSATTKSTPPVLFNNRSRNSHRPLWYWHWSYFSADRRGSSRCSVPRYSKLSFVFLFDALCVASLRWVIPTKCYEGNDLSIHRDVY